MGLISQALGAIGNIAGGAINAGMQDLVQQAVFLLISGRNLSIVILFRMMYLW